MNPRHTRPTPDGMHPSVELGTMPENAAIYVKGFLPARHGELNTAHLWRRTGRAPGDLRGMAIYAHRRLGPWLITMTRERHIMAARIEIARDANNKLVVGLSNFITLGSGALPHEHVDSTVAPWGAGGLVATQIDDELFWVPMHGGHVRVLAITPGKTHFAKAGIANRIGDTYYNVDRVVRNVSFDLGPIPVGTYKYALVPFDRKRRQGQPITQTRNGTPWTVSWNLLHRSVLVFTEPWPYGPEASYYALARAVQGTSDYYLVTPLRDATRRNLLYDATAEEDLPLRQRVLPDYECAPPPPSTYIHVHHGRLWVTDASYGHILQGVPQWTDNAAPRRLWWSNLRAPTQFSTSGTDGGYVEFDIAHDDRLMAMVGVRDDLLVLSKRRAFVVLGRDPDQFEIRTLADVGCCAPMSLRVIRGRPFWLAPQGVMTLDETGQPVPISVPVAQLLTGPWAGHPGGID